MGASPRGRRTSILAPAGVQLIVNLVICGLNVDDLPATVAMVADRWPRASFNVSFVAPSTDMVPRDAALVPRYTRALPRIDEAIAVAEERGVLSSASTRCVECHCVWCQPGCPDSSLPGRSPIGVDRGDFLRTEACAVCALKNRCWGLRRGYADIHGTTEPRSVTL